MIWNQKYPLSSSPSTKARITIGFGLFVAFFLAAFQPFELSAPEIQYRYFKIAGYGLITSLVLSIYHYGVIPRFNEQNWTLGKEVTAIILLILAIGILNYLYTIFIFSWHPINVHALFQFLFYTLAVGVFPVTILTIIKQNQLNRRYLEEAAAINAAMRQQVTQKVVPRTVLLKGDYSDELHINPGQILFLESAGNYLHIHYLEGGEVRKKELRSTLKKAAQQLLPAERLFKSHRAFLVNLDYVAEVSGNAQGLQLVLTAGTKAIPVSRSRVKAFKELHP